MERRSRKIFWGILLASVHIRLFDVFLFPSCFGFALLYLGIHDLDKCCGNVRKRSSRLIHTAAAALVLVTALSDFMTVAPLFDIGGIWQMVPAMLEYAVMFFLLDLYSGLRPSSAGLRRAYALVMGASVCGFGFSLMFASGEWQIFCKMVLMVCRVLVLKTAYSDCPKFTLNFRGGG